MQVCVLASGSKGNVTYVEIAGHHFLVDIGMSCRYVVKKLREIDVAPEMIEYIFLTHTHADHIHGLEIFLKKYSPIVVISDKMREELTASFPLPNTIPFDQLSMISFLVTIFPTSHDCEESYGYIFGSEENRLCYITDTGYIPEKLFPLLSNCSIYVVEANHDTNMLMECHYPYAIKQRILGDRGHLSNATSGRYLSHWIGNKTSTIILIHLSEENNSIDKAIATVTSFIEKEGKAVPNIYVSIQEEMTECILV